MEDAMLQQMELEKWFCHAEDGASARIDLKRWRPHFGVRPMNEIDMSVAEIHALLALLDDPDDSVFLHVRGQLLSKGKDVLKEETFWSMERS